MNNKEVKILIFGDICPTKDTQNAFNKGDRKAIFGDVMADIEEADVVIGNLECAVTDNPNPIQKTGPILFTGTKSLNTLRDFDAVSLANNHVRDCGHEGVMTAINTFNEFGINIFGAGLNFDEARKPLIIERNGLKIGLLSFAEREFNAATESRPGANCMDIYDDFDRIREFKKSVDYLIILYHGGIEYFPLPTPELRKKCRKMAECGADLITCQHSHCIGTIEQYEESTIVYGQGNSVFGYRANDTNWNRGLLLEVEILKNSGKKRESITEDKSNPIQSRINIIPIEATPNGLRRLTKDQAEELNRELEIRANLSEDEIIEAWDNFCMDLGKIHLPLLLGWPRILTAINRRTNNSLVKLLFGKSASNITHNLIRCDAHREVIDYILSKKDYN